ncbi:restriction endonuclease subunit S [Flavobacterium subsaxonicum]|uniref:restriction endonuclease subunit S n=1 Tax=Flavobacterium subsaxonicum TaxID=426226 RepID=UPI00041708C2|nr:restriction endonuclease subunit S [Flavobacterium subsaxonicum]
MSKILPEGWELVEIGDFCNIFYGKGLLSKDFIDTGYPVYGANGVIGAYSHYMFDQPKLLISCRGSMSGVTHITAPKSYVTANSIIIESLVREITNEYLQFAINSADKSNIITGSAQPQITIQNLKHLTIPIPSIAEQGQIVNTVTNALKKINSYKSIRELVPLLVKKIRKKVINDAVKGDLSKVCRNNSDTLQTGYELIEELKQVRIDGNPKTKLNEKAVLDLTTEKLPDAWVWTRLLNIADVIGGVTKGRKLKDRETIVLPYLRVANVQDGYLDLSEIKYIETLTSDLEKFRLEKGDILFTEGGDRDKLGRGTIWNNEIEDCIHQNHIFRARTNPSYINPEFIGIYTKSDTAKEYFFSNANQTVNLASINLTALSNIPIPIPPIYEQNYICKKVNNLLEQINIITEKHRRFCDLIDRTERMILEKAFNGVFSEKIDVHNDAKQLIEEAKQFSINYRQKKITNNTMLKQRFLDVADQNANKIEITEVVVNEINIKHEATEAIINNEANKMIKSKPVETYNELVERLENLGGEAYPEALLIATSLEEDIDLFYDLLKEARDQNAITVPIGHTGVIKTIIV